MRVGVNSIVLDRSYVIDRPKINEVRFPTPRNSTVSLVCNASVYGFNVSIAGSTICILVPSVTDTFSHSEVAIVWRYVQL